MRISKKVKDPETRPTEIDKMVTSFLNRLWGAWPAKTHAKNIGREKVQVDTYKNGNPKMLYKYKCQSCKELVDVVQVDHKDPRVPISGFTTLDDWVARTFCTIEGLQALCLGCHKKKSSEEASSRAAYRKTQKEP